MPITIHIKGVRNYENVVAYFAKFRFNCLKYEFNMYGFKSNEKPYTA